MPVDAGRGPWRSSTSVPASTRPWLNTPRSVRSSNGGVTKRTRTVSVADVTAGAASKYWLVS